MTRKRNKPYLTRHEQAPFSKRHRPIPPSTDEDPVTSKPTPPAAVVVMGLSPDCSVLDLKSRFEIYGAISRIRIDKDGVGYVSFRSKESAEAAIAASLDEHFGITIDSKRVQVIWSTDPLAQWRAGVTAGDKRETEAFSSSSKLLRAELPLRRHGRGNKLASAVVRPRSSDTGTASDEVEGSSLPELPSKGREIVAYDDIL